MRILMTLLAMIITLLSISTLFGCDSPPEEVVMQEEEIEAEPETPIDWSAIRDKQEKRWERIREEREAAEKAAEEILEELPPRKSRPNRRLKTYTWNTEEVRAKMWNIPEEDQDEATATAFLRICISEADGHESDCLGIWQVLENIRSRSCNRDMYHKITQCDDNGETLLSVMRRASKYILGVASPRNQRHRWIAEMELDCSEPASWPYRSLDWASRYGGQRCPRVAKLARRLVSGDRNFDWPIKGAHPVTWGGRCESGKGACDDRYACARGLARLHTDTHNAFWCIPGRPGCSNDIDPICLQQGFSSLLPMKTKMIVEPDDQTTPET